MKQAEDCVTVDLEDIFLWPCGAWCFRYESEQMNHLSDDYRVVHWNTPEYWEIVGEPD